MKILLTIRSLNFGGAERQWVNLAKGLYARDDIELLLCTFYSGGDLYDEVSHLPYVCVDKKGKSDFLFLCRYRKIIKDFKPDVIYAFMPDSNLFSLFASAFLNIPVVFGFRSSAINVTKLPFFSKAYFYAQKYCSKYAKAIVCNSNDAISFYKEYGYFMDRACVVYNGIDTACVKDRDNILKERLNLPKESIIFGIAARMNKVKDYPLFAKAARYLCGKNSNVYFISIGKIDDVILRECLDVLGDFKDRVLFLGAKDNVWDYYSIFDFILSTSYTESFSNSIAEGMACGALPIVSDVGESAVIANFGQDYKFCFNKRDERGLYKCLDSVISLSNDEQIRLSFESKKHIIDRFSISKMVDNTCEVLGKCI
ncbi:glycosyltransferase [Helicobacter sp. WB40]|uniref:glycosyltransferase n=1 Tax=Helicobacter sp. WB40 TaxID=3004130 RepID=UPI0022EBCCED|nr:glycosyltransferase [Helicobacter sp. WB40]MDA3966865.1 glycosyltransferase [Helicobacter sp. WB40]